MKKIRAWVFAVLMAVVLCACGEEQEQELADISTVEYERGIETVLCIFFGSKVFLCLSGCYIKTTVEH